MVPVSPRKPVGGGWAAQRGQQRELTEDGAKVSQPGIPGVRCLTVGEVGMARDVAFTPTPPSKLIRLCQTAENI